MYAFARPLLFALDPETAHELTLWSLHHFGGVLPHKAVQGTPVEVMGLKFPNRIGLAAGLDKNGEAIDKLEAGASLVQIYTGFIYRGPTLIAEAVRETSDHAAA